MYAGASGDFNPMHHDEVAGAGSRAAARVRARHVHRRDLLGRPRVTNYVGIGNLARRTRVRFTKQTWPGETLTTQRDVRGRAENGRASANRDDDAGDLPCGSSARATARRSSHGRGRRGVLPGDGCRAAMRFDLPTPDLETQPFWDGCQGGRVPHPALQRVRRGPLLPAAVLPEVLERRRRVEGGVGPRRRSTRTRSCTRTTCRRSTSGCRTSPRSSSSTRARA